MPRYRIAFEDMGFTDSAAAAENSLSPAELGGFNDQMRRENAFPPGVLAVLGAYATQDDNQGETNIKVFVPVSLLIEAESPEAAEAFPPPVDLLSRVADLVATIDEQCQIQLENAWERNVCEVDAVDDPYYDEGGVPVDLSLPPDAVPKSTMPRP